jgi:hypothetical protein
MIDRRFWPRRVEAAWKEQKAMSNSGTEQLKLAAIMFTDMVSYPDASGAWRGQDFLQK